MPVPTFRAQFAVPVLLAAMLSVISFTSLAEAKSKTISSDFRVVDSTGKSLAEGTQFTGSSTIKTSKKADCFGDGTGGSGASADVPGNTALGQLAYGGDAYPGISSLSITDSFDFGLGICGIGNAVAPSTGYWYLKINHAASFTGGDQTILKKGDEVLWLLIDDFNNPTPDELALKAPTKAGPGPVDVKVLSYADDGTKSAAPGAAVSGASEVTDAKGKTTITAGDGVSRIRATRAGSIPSNVVALCADRTSRCPAGYATKVGGTPKADVITGDRQAETIRAGPGKDTVDASQGSARDRINCGPGRDSLVLRAGSKSKVQSCEKVYREGPPVNNRT